MSLGWLIVGGGIHGVHVAARLIGEGGIPSEEVQILDPEPKLLTRWRARSQTIGMRHLRSPSVHHLGLDPLGLHAYAEGRWAGVRGLFAPPYDRPALSLFDAHCDAVIESLDLPSLHLRGKATSCELTEDGVHVQLMDGHHVRASQVVLAVGPPEQPQLPPWAHDAAGRVHHLFQPHFTGWPLEAQSVAVVGGGISAAQAALRLVDEGHEVHLIARHEFREHQFDSDPGWLGPKYMRGFARERSLDSRRQMITEARNKGSVPPDILRELMSSIRGGHIKLLRGEVAGLHSTTHAVDVELSSGDRLGVDTVLLATGFGNERPGGELVEGLIRDEGLPCSECGFPIVDEGLRWHPRVYVTGALAELVLGPTGRNIAGARRSAERILRSLGPHSQAEAVTSGAHGGVPLSGNNSA